MEAGMREVKLIPFSRARVRVLSEARALVHSSLEHFGQIATPEQVEYAATKITDSVMRTMRWPEDEDRP
jgi:hypothetical protein